MQGNHWCNPTKFYKVCWPKHVDEIFQPYSFTICRLDLILSWSSHPGLLQEIGPHWLQLQVLLKHPPIWTFWHLYVNNWAHIAFFQLYILKMRPWKSVLCSSSSGPWLHIWLQRPTEGTLNPIRGCLILFETNLKVFSISQGGRGAEQPSGEGGEGLQDLREKVTKAEISSHLTLWFVDPLNIFIWKVDQIFWSLYLLMQEWKRLIFTQSGSISSHTLVPRSLFRYACNIYLVIVSRLVTHLTTNATYHNTTLISLFRYFLLHCTMEKLQWEVGNKNFSFLREKYIWNIWTRIKWKAKLKNQKI